MASPYLPVTLTDLRVLVTAGAPGIGRTIAEAFLVGGARVWVCDIADAALADIASAQRWRGSW